MAQITTSRGHVIVLRDMLNGRGRQNIEDVSLAVAVLDEDQSKVIGIRDGATGRIQEARIAAAVLSVDGKTENVVDLVLDLDEDECDEVLVEVDKVARPLPKKTGSSSETNTSPTSETDGSIPSTSE